MRTGLFTFLLALLLATASAQAQGWGKGERRGFGGGGEGRSFGGGDAPPSGPMGQGAMGLGDWARAFMPRRADETVMEARGFIETGLRPAYPDGVKCPTADSFLGDPSRGDGSHRNSDFFAGRHGGMDIPAPKGTPVIAAADGTVVNKHVGDNIGGIGIILQHAPADTGLPVWTYTEYKHLNRIPDIPLGTRVKMGEVIGETGTTGTEGGHYGSEGHAHVHMTAWYSRSNAYVSRRVFIPRDGYWLDPLALFRGPPIESRTLAALPSDRKKVPIHYKTPDGRVHPANTKTVWPLLCHGGLIAPHQPSRRRPSTASRRAATSARVSLIFPSSSAA